MTTTDPNENQGRRQDQIEGSYKISFASLVLLAIIIAALAILNHCGLLPQV